RRHRYDSRRRRSPPPKGSAQQEPTASRRPTPVAGLRQGSPWLPLSQSWHTNLSPFSYGTLQRSRPSALTLGKGAGFQARKPVPELIYEQFRASVNSVRDDEAPTAALDRRDSRLGKARFPLSQEGLLTPPRTLSRCH